MTRTLPPVHPLTAPVTVLPSGYTRHIPPTTQGRIRSRLMALRTDPMDPAVLATLRPIRIPA